ncbi:hypothetical protein IV203_020164 [Nitzschia inconspicua]|uniref:Uncharacterized protein n=1 Tax=Nitzschia inconspicua TaxID=303405 RepID=A0A9K3K942_9STRA|nr:hypothetical protein IV203_020354 [Nitzschia inconspicua]KAG7371594.1 hypothetical protein IV203_020164 [Nitzschia inconspicua]
MSDDAAATAAAAAATTLDATPTYMNTNSCSDPEITVAVAADANVLETTSTFQPATNNQNNSVENLPVTAMMVMDPETAPRWDTPTTTSPQTPKPTAVAFPINSSTAAQQRANKNKDSHKVCMCVVVVASIIAVVIILALLVGGKSSHYNNTPAITVYYYDSFEAFCFSVMGFYALEQPWLNCRCDLDSYWIECQGTRPTQDYSFTSLDSSNFNNTNETTVLPDHDAPLVVVMFQYSNMYGASESGYIGTSCECATQSCDPDTTQCFEVDSYDYSSSCRITNNVTWGDSICTVFNVEQDIFGNEHSSFHDACQLCGGLPQTDEGYYFFNTSGCGSDFNHGNTDDNKLDQNYCVPSFIPNQALLYGAMTTAAHHTPNQQLLNSMQSSAAFCDYMINKYQYEIGGYTCACIEQVNHNNDNPGNSLGGDDTDFVECRPDHDTSTYVKWQRLYWPHGVDSFGAPNDEAYTWGIAPLTYPVLLLGESCQCSEPTCTVSPVSCTALSYNFETYGCRVYHKLNETADVGICGSQECSICELSPGDEDTGVVRVDTSSCNDGQPACRETNFFL